MSWASPGTFVAGTVPTAGFLNVYRDDLNALRAGDLAPSTGNFRFRTKADATITEWAAHGPGAAQAVTFNATGAASGITLDMAGRAHVSLTLTGAAERLCGIKGHSGAGHEVTVTIVNNQSLNVRHDEGASFSGGAAADGIFNPSGTNPTAVAAYTKLTFTYSSVTSRWHWAG